MDVTVVVGVITGIGGIVVGVLSATFAAGQKYEGLQETSKRQDKLEKDIEDCQTNTGAQFKKCQDDEIRRMGDLTTLLNTHNTTMATLTTGLAALTKTLEFLPTQKDLTAIVDRLSHIEGMSNGRIK